jgi:hypothetical protein
VSKGFIVGGDTTPTPPAEGFASPTPEEQRVIRTLYDAESSTTADKFYGFSSVQQAVDVGWPELSKITGATEADRGRVRGEFVDLAQKSGLPEGLVVTLAQDHLTGQIADAREQRDDPDGAAQRLDQQIAAWNAETRERLTAQYGARDSEQLLARAQRFVKAHPTLERVLRHRGLGSRPDVVEQIVAHVFSNGIR